MQHVKRHVMRCKIKMFHIDDVIRYLKVRYQQKNMHMQQTQQTKTMHNKEGSSSCWRTRQK